LQSRGFYNPQLFEFLTKYGSVAFSDCDQTISTDHLKTVEICNDMYLVLGQDSAGEFEFAIKQYDAQFVYELSDRSEVDEIGTFFQFVLLTYLYERADDMSIQQAIELIRSGND